MSSTPDTAAQLPEEDIADPPSPVHGVDAATVRDRVLAGVPADPTMTGAAHPSPDLSAIAYRTATRSLQGRHVITIDRCDEETGNYYHADVEPFGDPATIGSYPTRAVEGRDDLLLVNIGGEWVTVSVEVNTQTVRAHVE